MSQIDKTMKNTENINEEIKGIAPIFSRIEKPISDSPNAAYFEQLQKNIWSEINQTVPAIQKESWLDNLRQKMEWIFMPKYALSIAVVFSFLLLAINYFSFQNTNNTQMLASLSTTEIQSFLAENIDEFDEQILIQENQATPSLDKNVSEEQIRNYLENDYSTELL